MRDTWIRGGRETLGFPGSTCDPLTHYIKQHQDSKMVVRGRDESTGMDELRHFFPSQELGVVVEAGVVEAGVDGSARVVNNCTHFIGA